MVGTFGILLKNNNTKSVMKANTYLEGEKEITTICWRVLPLLRWFWAIYKKCLQSTAS